MKILPKIPLSIIIIFLIIWVGALLNCTILTIMHAKEFHIPDEVIAWSGYSDTIVLS
jgi:hypothetical protein